MIAESHGLFPNGIFVSSRDFLLNKSLEMFLGLFLFK